MRGVPQGAPLVIGCNMIRQEITLRQYGWRVRVYYAVSKMYCDEIMDDLYDIGCRGKYLREAYDNLSEGNVDTGLTFSNYDLRATVMVIAKTSTPAQFLNSYDHERKHLEAHIAQAYGLNPYGEKIAYLCGEIGQKLYPVSRMFICEHCREQIKSKI